MKNNKKIRIIDTKVWKTGNGFVITIPISIVRKFKIKEGEEVTATLFLDEK